MASYRDLLAQAAERASDYYEKVARGPVFPGAADIEAVRTALGSLADGPVPADRVVDELAEAVEPALVGTTGPRYFGFVVGGALEAAAAADVLTIGWDQPAFNAVTSPGAAVVEDIAGSWLKELLGVPAGASFGFVTGGQGANTVALAAARNHVLAQAGWDVEQRGLPGAPAVRVVANAERHATIDRAPAAVGAGHRGPRTGGHRRPGGHRRRRARTYPGPRRPWPHDRVPAGRQRQQRCLRRLHGGDPRRLTGTAPGPTSTAPSGCGRRPTRAHAI